MIINNSKSVINLKIIRRAAIIIYLSLLLLVFVARIIRFPILGIDKTVFTIIISVIFFLIIVIPHVLNYQYVYYSDEGDTIIFRYFSAGILPGNKNSIEISKKTFSGFTIDKKLFGLVKSITLYQRLREGIAKYPPVYLGALKETDKAKIIRSLKSYAPVINS